MRYHRKNKNVGVTLVELMLAVTIILIVGVSCIQVLQYNSRATTTILKRLQASHVVDQISDHLRRSNVEALEAHYERFPQIIKSNDFLINVSISDLTENKTRMALIKVMWTINQTEHVITQDVLLAIQ